MSLFATPLVLRHWTYDQYLRKLEIGSSKSEVCWEVRRTGVSGLVARGAEGGAGLVVVARERDAGCEGVRRRQGGAGGAEVGVEPELFYEGAAGEYVSTETGKG